MTEDEYQISIPYWCGLTTTEQHKQMLGVCWGITMLKVINGGEDYCSTCEFYKKLDRQNIKDG